MIYMMMNLMVNLVNLVNLQRVSFSTLISALCDLATIDHRIHFWVVACGGCPCKGALWVMLELRQHGATTCRLRRSAPASARAAECPSNPSLHLRQSNFPKASRCHALQGWANRIVQVETLQVNHPRTRSTCWRALPVTQPTLHVRATSSVTSSNCQAQIWESQHLDVPAASFVL